MTTIIFATKPAVDSFIGIADTQSTRGNVASEVVLSDSKIFCPPNADNLVFGFAGHVSVKTALRSLKVQSVLKKDPPREQAALYASNVVMPTVRNHLNQSFPPGSEFVYGPEFELLVWIKGTDYVFRIGHDFSVTQSSSGFYSVGSGGDFAEASFDLNPNGRIMDHMEYAAKRDLFTSGPFHVYQENNID